MGGRVGGGVGIDSEPSPRRAAIEKAQAELRQEFVVREERRRELEFLEKGGNLLDFKFGEATSVGFLSPSPTDPLAEQFLTSEAKASFTLNASPNRDSTESNGRLGTVLGSGLNTADNFAGDTEVVYADRSALTCDGKVIVALEGQTTHVEGNQTENHIKESEDSGGVRMGVKGYERRNKHNKSNHYTGHSSLRDSVKVGVGDRSPTLSSGIKGLGEAKDTETETHGDKHCSVFSVSTSKATTSNQNGILEPSMQKKLLGTDSEVLQKEDASRDAANTHYEESCPGSKDVTSSQKVQKHQFPKEIDADQDAGARNITTPMVGYEGENPASSDVNDEVVTDKLVQDAIVVQMNSSCINEDDEGNKAERECIHKGTAIDKGKTGNSETNSFEKQERHDIHECANNSLHEKTLMPERMSDSRSLESRKECSELNHTDLHTKKISNSKPDDKFSVISDVMLKSEEGLQANTITQTEVPRLITNQALKVKKNMQVLDNKDDKEFGNVVSSQKGSIRPQSKLSMAVSGMSNKHPGVNHLSEKEKNPTVSSEVESHKPNLSAAAKRAHEDIILEEAKNIKAKLKKTTELAKAKPFESPRRKSLWDIVIEEMRWLANDFMQERLWKIALAAQVVREAAENRGEEEFQERLLYKKQRKDSRMIAAAVLKFWQEAEAFLLCKKDNSCPLMSQKKMSNEEEFQMEVDGSDARSLALNKETEVENSDISPLQQYAIRYLKHMKDNDRTVQAEAPSTPDRLLDAGILEPFWEDQFPEESLFYTVPCGAMEAYRNSITSYWASLEKENVEVWTDADAQAGTDASDGALGIYKYGISDYADDTRSHSGFSPRDRMFCEDEDEIRMQFLPGAFEGSKATKTRKRRKSIMKSTPKTYMGRIPPGEYHGLSLGNKPETNPGIPLPAINGKRTSSSANINVSGAIPTKRIRSSTVAARQRAAGSLSGGTTGVSSLANKTDVSSGDTSSLQDEFNTLTEGTQPRKSMDIDSCGKSLQFDGADMSVKAKKKKKSKQFGMGASSTAMDGVGILGPSGKSLDYESKWQQDVTSQLDQREQAKRKFDSQGFPVGTVLGSASDHQITHSQGFIAQSTAKKPKLSKQLSDMSPEAGTPASILAPSPGASQMSNMSNPNKPIKVTTNRDKGRKNKIGKVAAIHTGQGIPWSTFEDQALVVLVHDVGPNWELVSDIINTSLQIKCIFRKPKDCKERHKSLMERTSGDGDSPDDSGSSQPYPSTLPGIPKGSARMLLQRLQGPMEEEALKTHLEKIVQIGQQQHARKSQNDNQEQKQRCPVHPSHLIAVKHLGGPFTPLDLCDQPSPNTEVPSHPYQIQAPLAGGLGITNSIGIVSPVQAGSVGIPSLQGANNLPLGAGLVASSAALNVAASSRDMQRFASVRPISVSMDEQQRMQQYNHMVAARSLQTHGVSMPVSLPMGLANSNDRGARMLQGGNAPGMMPGLNRGMSLPRPGYPGIGSPGILTMASSGINNMLPCSGVGLSATGTVTAGAIAGQGNLISRSRDSMQMLQPGQSTAEQRQMIMQELQMQAAQGNGQAVAPFSNLSGSFSNQMVSSPSQNFSGQHQQHQITQGHNNLQNSQVQNSNHNQAYMIQQQRQRFLQQQHFPPNGSPLSQSQPHTLSQTKHTISTLPNNPHQQQHSLPQHVLQQQHTSSQQQSKSQSPPTLQHQSPQQSGASLNPSVLQNVQKRQIGIPQTQGQSSQCIGQANLQQNQMQKQHHQRQQQLQQLKHQAQTQQQQKSQLQGPQQHIKVSKGLERGSIMMQNLSTETGQINGPQAPIPGHQQTEKGDQIVHQVPGQRVFHGTGSLQPGKQLIQSGISAQQGQGPGQASVSMPLTTNLSQPQKGFPQQSASKQQPPVSLSTDNHQASVSSPLAAQLQQQMPACQPQSCSVPVASLASSSQQQRQSVQSQQPVHRKLSHRQTGSDAGLQPLPQPSKTCIPQDQVTSQLPSQQGHLTFQVGSNVGSPLSTVATCSAASITSINANTTAVNSVQWKPGHSNAQTTGMPYNLSSHNTVSGAQISPTATTSGMLLPSSNGNTSVSTTTTSGMLSPGTNIAGNTQRQYASSVGPVHGHNMGSHPTIGARPTVQQIGVQWQPQQQQQRPSHNGLQNSMSNSLGSPYIEPPTSGPM